MEDGEYVEHEFLTIELEATQEDVQRWREYGKNYVRPWRQCDRCGVAVCFGTFSNCDDEEDGSDNGSDNGSANGSENGSANGSQENGTNDGTPGTSPILSEENGGDDDDDDDDDLLEPTSIGGCPASGWFSCETCAEPTDFCVACAAMHEHACHRLADHDQQRWCSNCAPQTVCFICAREHADTEAHLCPPCREMISDQIGAQMEAAVAAADNDAQ